MLQWVLAEDPFLSSQKEVETHSFEKNFNGLYCSALLQEEGFMGRARVQTHTHTAATPYKNIKAGFKEMETHLSAVKLLYIPRASSSRNKFRFCSGDMISMGEEPKMQSCFVILSHTFIKSLSKYGMLFGGMCV